MTRVILSFIFLLGLAVNGQTSMQYGVYLTADDFAQKKLIDGFDAAPENSWDDTGREVLRATIDGTLIIYDYQEIWGFRSNGTDWRVLDDEFFKVSYCGDEIIIYTLPGYIPYDQPIVYDTRYFSTDASGKMYPLTRRNLRKVYSNKVGFLQKLDSLPIPVSQWNRQCNCYPVAQWLE